jgi:hypothetical protein
MSRRRTAFGAATRRSGTRLVVLALLLESPWLAACWTPVCLKGPDPLPFRGESLGYRCERDEDCRQGKCILGRDDRLCLVGERYTAVCRRDEDCREGRCVTVRPAVATCSVGDAPCLSGTVETVWGPPYGAPDSHKCLTRCQADADCRFGTISGYCAGCVKWGDGLSACGKHSESHSPPWKVLHCLVDHCTSDDQCPAGYRCVGGTLRDDGLRSKTSLFSCSAGFCQAIADRDGRPPAAEWEDQER